MTKNQILNTAIGRLLIQGEYAMDGGSCKYYNDVGNKCAVGVLFSDEDARNLPSGPIDMLQTDILPVWVGENIALLITIQGMHDLGATLKPARPFLNMILEMSGLQV